MENEAQQAILALHVLSLTDQYRCLSIASISHNLRDSGKIRSVSFDFHRKMIGMAVLSYEERCL